MIFLTRSVALDGLLSNTYFVKLIAYDTVYPNIQATATATINVNRNPNPPIFNPSTYRVTLSENHALGSAVVDVNATDADFVRLHFLQKFSAYHLMFNVLIPMPLLLSKCYWFWKFYNFRMSWFIPLLAMLMISAISTSIQNLDLFHWSALLQKLLAINLM